MFEERRLLWEQIKKIIDIFNVPWVCIGDFNYVKDAMEKDGGQLKSRRKIDCF